jgi:hypothetical protein
LKISIWSNTSRRSVPTRRSQIAFAREACGGELMIRTPPARKTSAKTGVFEDRQAIHLGAVQQIDSEQVGGDDRYGLGPQELCPGRPGPSRRGFDPGFGQDLPYRRGCDPDAEAREFTVDPPAPPGRILLCQA